MLSAGLLFALISQTISGQVTDKASREPLSRIVVTLYNAERKTQAEAITAKDGRYEFAGLAPGKYSIGADNDDHVATYLRQWFGIDEPAAPFGAPPSANVALSPGEARTNVDLALTRALAIEGHVLDPQGAPVRGASVSATYADGRTPGAYSATSDDLGAYRIFGLRAGLYRVCGAAPFGTNDATSPGGTPLARTCYPDMSITTQDTFNIDIHMQPRDPNMTGSETAAPAASTDAHETGAIHGVVIDKPSGRPIPHAAVHVGFQDPSQPRADLATRTNANGAFTLTGLTPGRYDGFAIATGHVIASLSDRDNNHLLTVRTGETLQASATLGRAYAIRLRLTDGYDLPIANVRVSVRALDTTLPFFPLEPTSDDLGRVRVADLPPGRYVVCAEPPESAASGRGPLPPRRDRLLRTCYPSAADEPDARPVTIADGDVDGLEIRLARGRTGSISGTILDASGAPASHADIELKKFTTDSTHSTWLTTDVNGRFRVSNVQTGTYAIDAAQGDAAAFVSVRLEDEDVENVEIALRKTVTVAGRVIGDDPAGPPPPVANGRVPLVVAARLADDRLPGEGSSLIATANSDGTFSMTGLFGRRTIEVMNPPPGWFVKAIRYGGADVIDTAADFKSGDEPLEIVLSTRGASLGGSVTDVSGRGVDRAEVLLFRAPFDKDDAPRLADSTRSVNGTYRFGPLREGDYFIVAVAANVRIPEATERDRLAQLAALGERVTLTDLDQRTIDLRVNGAPGSPAPIR